LKNHKGGDRKNIMNRLSAEAIKVIVEKALNRKEQPLKEIAKLYNIGLSTLNKWIRKYKAGSPVVSAAKVRSANGVVSAADRFKHVLAISKLDDTGVGVYCREQGLYSFQLQQWESEFMSYEPHEKNQETEIELKALRAENKVLKQDLLRKDRALAETTALLVLKKKANLLFGGHEDA
jgi:transposase